MNLYFIYEVALFILFVNFLRKSLLPVINNFLQESQQKEIDSVNLLKNNISETSAIISKKDSDFINEKKDLETMIEKIQIWHKNHLGILQNLKDEQLRNFNNYKDKQALKLKNSNIILNNKIMTNQIQQSTEMIHKSLNTKTITLFFSKVLTGMSRNINHGNS